MTAAAPETAPETEDAREAADVGEKPDLGHRSDALVQALSGTDSGSDTRAGSLRGGAATGSDIDPDQDAINEALASEGMASAAPREPDSSGADAVRNTGRSGANGKDADAATG